MTVGAEVETATSIIVAELEKQTKHMRLPPHVVDFLRHSLSLMDLTGVQRQLALVARVPDIHTRNYEHVQIRARLQRTTRIFVDRTVAAGIKEGDDPEDYFYILDEWFVNRKVKRRIAAFCNYGIYPCFDKSHGVTSEFVEGGS